MLLWDAGVVIREPAQLTIGEDGTVILPLGLLAEAGLPPGSFLLAYSDGDGRIVLRRAEDAMRSLLEDGTL
ncbi:hypothetical protein [Streptomyces djakartensis]|uniref:hypothetical protein n=1 Tax=Streptomyces djakartensis TaxID=68193 RepID=UPI0034DF3925